MSMNSVRDFLVVKEKNLSKCGFIEDNKNPVLCGTKIESFVDLTYMGP